MKILGKALMVAAVAFVWAVLGYQWGFEAGVINGGTLAAQGCR